MKRVPTFAAALLVSATTALAAEQQPAEENPMAAWKPPKLAHESDDKKQITALFKAMEDAGKKGDLEAAAALIDFPVLMITDDSKGEATGEAWTREQWSQVMAPFYKKPMGGTVTHKPTIFVVTDSLASAGDEWSHTMGKNKMSGRSATLFVRKDGKWLVKAMVEGGWGDAMKQPAPGAAGEGGAAPGTPAGGGTGGAAGSGQPQ